MSTQFVWRVQNEKGNGPYRDLVLNKLGRHWEVWAEECHDKDTGRPEPHETSLDSVITRKIANRENFLFGFETLEQLHNWFSEVELDVLCDAGFQIKRIPARDIHSDGYQCIFEPVV